MLLPHVGLRHPHAGHVLLQVGVDDADLLAGVGVGARGQPPEHDRGGDQQREHGQRHQRQLDVGGEQRHGDPDDGEQADDGLGQTGLQERRQRVDVGGHAGHDPAGQLALVVVEPQPLQVGVAAHAQEVEHALARPRRGHRLQRHDQPARRHDGHAEQRGDHEDAGHPRGDAAVDGVPGDVGEGQRAQRIEGDEHHGHGDQPAHRVEQPGQPEAGIGCGRVDGQPGLVRRRREGLDRGQQLRGGGDAVPQARAAHPARGLLPIRALGGGPVGGPQLRA